MPEWLKGTDCKSVGASLRWFESTPAQFNKLSLFESFSKGFFKADLATCLPRFAYAGVAKWQLIPRVNPLLALLDYWQFTILALRFTNCLRNLFHYGGLFTRTSFASLTLAKIRCLGLLAVHNPCTPFHKLLTQFISLRRIVH